MYSIINLDSQLYECTILSYEYISTDHLSTQVHPNPPYDNATALDLILDRMQEVGLYLMYDMRL